MNHTTLVALSRCMFWFTKKNWLIKAIAHWVRNFRMRFSVFPYSPSFPIKMHATDAKMQKIEPDPNFFWRTKVSEAVCKRDWHNVRSYLFLNVWKFRRKISDSVCRDLKNHLFMNQTTERCLFQPTRTTLNCFSINRDCEHAHKYTTQKIFLPTWFLYIFFTK